MRFSQHPPTSPRPPMSSASEVAFYSEIIRRQAAYIDQLERDLAHARRQPERNQLDTLRTPDVTPGPSDVTPERELLRETWRVVGGKSARDPRASLRRALLGAITAWIA